MKNQLFSCFIFKGIGKPNVIPLSFVLCLLSLVFRPLSTSAQVPSYVPTSGLVGWWPFNGNGNDLSGNGNDLANTNGVVNYASDRNGVSNSCASFNGSVYLSKSNPTLPTGNSNRTYSVWVKMNQATSGTAFSQNGAYCDNFAGLFCGIDGAYFWGKCNDRSWGYTTTTAQWNHIVIVYDNSVMYCFRNGVLINVANSTYYNFPTPLNTGSSSFFVGYPAETNGSWPLPMNGNVDDLAIYNRALTQQEITNLYTSSAPPSIATTASPSLINCGESTTLTASSTSAGQPCVKADLPATLQTGLVGYWPFCGNANDASGNNNNGTVNGATLTTDRFGIANSAYSFDGNDYIEVPDNASLNNSNISVGLWLKTNSSIYQQVLYKVSLTTAQSEEYSLPINLTAPNKVNLDLKNNSCVPGIGWMSFSNNATLNNWAHVSFTHNGSVTKFYLNGVLVNSQVANFNIANCPGGKLLMGISFDMLNGLNGSLDDIAIYNRALSASEVQQLYNLGNVSYSWSTGAITPSITVSPAQTSAYTCTVTNSAGSTTSSVTVNVADTLNWTGLVDTDWHKPCNWSPQFVPKCCNNVVIPLTSNQPIVSGVAAAEDLTIYTTNGAQLTVNNGANLQIADCPTTITTAACPSLVAISTTAVTSIAQTTAVSGGIISNQGASAITARGICWSTSQNPTIANSFTTNGTGVGTFTSNLTGLTAGTTYYVRAYATNASGTSYGNQVSFVSQNIQIGEFYQGGIVAYVFQPGEPGFVYGEQHGIIASPNDLSGAPWGCYTLLINGADGVGIGDGLQNTIDIVNHCTQSGIAATLCLDLILNNYSDWFLPSIAELYYLYQNLFVNGFGNFVAGSNYWSSSETNSDFAVVYFFGNGGIVSNRYKHNNYPANVRAIRYF